MSAVAYTKSLNQAKQDSPWATLAGNPPVSVAHGGNKIPDWRRRAEAIYENKTKGVLYL